MNTVQEHWAEVIDERTRLYHKYGDANATVYLMSLRRRKQGIVEGQISPVRAHMAALLIAQDTHREATPEEVSTWNQEQAVRKLAIESEAASKKTQVQINLGDQLTAALAGIQAAATQRTAQADADRIAQTQTPVETVPQVSAGQKDKRPLRGSDPSFD